MIHFSTNRQVKIACVLAGLPLLAALAGCGVTQQTSASLEQTHISTTPAAGITHLTMDLDGIGLKVHTTPGIRNITIHKVVSPNIRVSETVSGHTLTFNMYDPSYTLQNAPTYVRVDLPPGRSLNVQTDGGAIVLSGAYQTVTVASEGGAVNGTAFAAQTCTITDPGGAVSLSSAHAGKVLAIQNQDGAISLTGPLASRTLLKNQGGAVSLHTVPQVETRTRIADAGGSIAAQWPGITVGPHGHAAGTVPGHTPAATLSIQNQGGTVSLD